MKTPSRRTAALFATLLLAIAGSSASALDAQSSNPPQHSSADAATFSIDFKGGPITEYVAQLRKAAGSIPINISVASELGDLMVPPISLQSVTPFIAIQALQQISDEASRRVNVSTVADEGGVMLYLIRSAQEPRQWTSQPRHPDADTSKSRLVLSLTPVVGAASDGSKDERLNVVLSAVESTLRLGRPDSEPLPDLALHRDSNLLIMLGTDDDRSTVRSVVEQIANTTRSSGATVETRAFELLSAQAPDVVRAIREVIPDFYAETGHRNNIKIESPTKLSITGSTDLLLKMAGIIAYVDQPAKVNPEVLRLHAQIEVRESGFLEKLDASRQREADLQGQLRALQAQLSAVNREAESADFKRKATEEKNVDLQKELATAKARIQDFVIEYGALQKALEDARAQIPKP